MKKLVYLGLAMVLALSGCSKETETELVDTYTSASTTKLMLSGSELETAKAALSEIDSDLATLADTQKEGYQKPENEKFVQILTINPDGTPNSSTIHAWKLEGNEVKVVLTDGQSAQNISEVGKRCTILVHGDTYFQLHLEVSNVEILEYSDDNFNAGKFNASYSGKDAKLSESTVTFNVLAVEQVNLYIPN